MRKFLFLNSAQRFSDLALLLMRVFVGLFLDLERLGQHDRRAPACRNSRHFSPSTSFRAPRSSRPSRCICSSPSGWASCWACSRAGPASVCVVIFVVAIAMVDRFDGMRGIFPSGCLVVIGLYLATHGAGRFSVDAALRGQ